MKDKQVLNLPMHCTDVFAVFLLLHVLYLEPKRDQ